MQLHLTIAALLCATLSAQGAYEWDHPDGVGVRYLLYKKMRKRPINAKIESKYLRHAYVPTDPDDFVRVKGLPLEWGIDVFEFPADAGMTFETYVEEHPSEGNVRTIRVPGREAAGEVGGRYWEYLDQFAGYGVKQFASPRPNGKSRWAQSDAVGVRFAVPEKMIAQKVDAKKVGRFVVADLRPHGYDRIRVRSRPKPLSWNVRLYQFPGEGGFAGWYGARPNREVVVGGERRNELRRFEWREARGTLVYHSFAALAAVAGGEAALVCTLPSDRDKLEDKHRRLAEGIVGSLTTELIENGKIIGPKYYHVATSYELDGREVALVAVLPIARGDAPDAALLARARKMVKSLRPAD